MTDQEVQAALENAVRTAMYTAWNESNVLEFSVPDYVVTIQAGQILSVLRAAGWRSPDEVKALIKPWEDEARASRGTRAGCTI